MGELLLQQVAAGLATGAIYASLSLALVMIYQVTHHVNFAQGEMATFSTYMALALIQAGLGYWQTFALTVALSFALGAAIQQILLRPLAHVPELANVGVFIGLMLVFNSITGWLFSYTVVQFPTPFEGGTVFGIVSRHELGAFLTTLAMLVAVYAFFRFTELGLALRAAAYNPVSSRLVGINVDTILAVGWGLAAAIGAVAGMMIAPIVFLDPNMMSGILIYAFAGALLGGITSPAGSVAGGFAVGVIENLAGTFLAGPQLKLSVALVIIVVVLTVKPTGLFGKTIVTRV